MRPGYNVTSVLRTRGGRGAPGEPLPWGLEQEQRLRDGLARDERFDVQASVWLDQMHKIDFVVLRRDEPHLPPVGVQFTTRHDPDKQARTVGSIRRDSVVSHLAYVEARCPIGDEVVRLVGQLVDYTARRSLDGAIMSAVVWYDSAARVFRARVVKVADAQAA